MPVRSGRRVAAIVAVLAIALVVSFQQPPATDAHAGLDRFMYALGQVESGGNYTARNPTSGAYGKYQIMPYNWGPWALKYLGDASAPQTPANQETVARAKVHELYHWLGLYSRTAYWWLTGSSKTGGWTDYATRYVEKVMAAYRSTYTVAAPTAEYTRYSEKSSRIAYTGTWRTASHTDYRGDSVRQAVNRGQTATFTFSGSKVAWNGPKGPTRGKAQVWIDGVHVKTVDLYASRFAARNRLYTRSFSGSGPHTLMITVLGTSGRPVVAIDEFIVWP